MVTDQSGPSTWVGPTQDSPQWMVQIGKTHQLHLTLVNFYSSKSIRIRIFLLQFQHQFKSYAQTLFYQRIWDCECEVANGSFFWNINLSKVNNFWYGFNTPAQPRIPSKTVISLRRKVKPSHFIRRRIQLDSIY